MFDYENERAWYVIQSYSGCENAAKNNLERRIKSMNMEDYIFRVLIPETVRYEKKKNGEMKEIVEKQFPGYIFVRMDLYNEDGTVDESAWYSVRNVQSVIGFLGGTNHPAPLSKQEIVSIFRNNNTNEQEAKPKISFEIGETESPIIPLYVRDTEKTFIVTKMAFDEGIFINPVIPPACAPDDTLVRVALMATHTREQVDTAIDKLTKCFKQLGIIE